MCIQFTIKNSLNGLLDNRWSRQITFDNGGERSFRGNWLTVTAAGLEWTNLPTADDSILLAPNELLGASSLQICYYSFELLLIFLEYNKSLILRNIMPVKVNNPHQPNEFFVAVINVMTQIAKFMGPSWGPPRSFRPQMGPMLAPGTLLSGIINPHR